MKKLKLFFLVLLFTISLSLVLAYFFLIPLARSKAELILTNIGISNETINGLTLVNPNRFFLAELGFTYRAKNQIITVKAKNISLDFSLNRDKRPKPIKLSLESLSVIHREKTKAVVTQDEDYNNLFFKNYAAYLPLPSLEIHNLKINSSLLETNELEIRSLKILTLLEKFISLSAEFNSKGEKLLLKGKQSSDLLSIVLQKEKEIANFQIKAKNKNLHLDYTIKPLDLSTEFEKYFEDYKNFWTAYSPKTIKGELEISLNPFIISGTASSDVITLSELNLKLKRPRLEFELKDLANKKLIIKNSSFLVFNGKITGSGSFLFDGSSDLNISLDNLDLKSLMDYYPQDKISAEGSISGNLPLKTKNGAFTISNGKVKATTPGKIKAELFSDNGSTSLNSQLALLSKALKNYNYSSLSSELNLSKKGDLQIALHLKGNNPDFQNGREVNLNIDITENIPALIKTLKLTSSLEESLTKR